MRVRFVLMGLISIGVILVSGVDALALTRYVDAQCPSAVSTYTPSTRACTGGTDLVYPTSALGVAALAAGDILYYRAGQYGGVTNPPSGTGAAGRTVLSAYPMTRTCSGHNPADPTTCVGSTYEPVILQRPTGAIVQITGQGGVPGPKIDRHWITVEGFIIDGSTGDNNGITITGGGAKATNFPACDNGSKGADTTPDHLRFLNNEVRHARNQGLLGEMWNDHIELIGNWFHHNGTDANTDHGIYLGGSDNWIVLNRINSNKRYGIHQYAQPTGAPEAPLCDPYSERNLIERNLVWGNSTGIGVLRGSINTTVRNNVVWSNTREGIYLQTGYTGVNKVYNNTSVMNGLQGLYLDANASHSNLRNNIYDGLFQHVEAINVTNTNNYNWSGSNPSPNFVAPDAAMPDFRLRAGDARINAGFNLTSEGVTIDFDGNARPVGGAFDIGAFEFDSGGPPVQSFDFSIDTDVPEDASVTMVQGASDVVAVTVTKLAGTAAAVTFSATGLPSGTTISFDPVSCTPTPTSCTTDATVTVPNTTPQGTYVVTVLASTGGGSPALVRSATFTLHVICN